MEWAEGAPIGRQANLADALAFKQMQRGGKRAEHWLAEQSRAEQVVKCW